MNQKLAVVAFGAVLLAGCGGTLPVPQTVEVPVAVGCVTQRIARPSFKSDAEYKAIADAATAIDSLWIERKERQAYEGRLEAVQAGCPDAPAE